MLSVRHLSLTISLLAAAAIAGIPAAYAKGGPGGGGSDSFLGSLVSTPSLSANTVPPNGDGNPYGVAIVPHGFPAGGATAAGDILVSNFNNGAGKQGTGTTIVSLTPTGTLSTFFTAPSTLGPVGLTTALVALKSGVVIVGNTPTTDGTSATVSDGSLIFLDRNGNVLLNLQSSTLLQGPWDMTASDSGRAADLYVSNVLSGTVTRVRIRVHNDHSGTSVKVLSMVQVASGFQHRTDPAALLVGPTGLLLTADGGKHGHSHSRRNGGGGLSLYVADTGNDRLQLVRGVSETKHDQGAGRTVVSGGPLEGPLALAEAPNGDIILSNGDAAGPAE